MEGVILLQIIPFTMAKKTLFFFLFLLNINLVLANNVHETYTSIGNFNANQGNCGVINEDFNSYANGAQIVSIGTITSFTNPVPTSFWGGWNTGQVLGGALIPEPRFQSRVC